jgi:DNA replication protein DnaC
MWFPQSLYADKDLPAFRQLKAIKDDIKNWVKEGNSLYLYSKSFGNGKTSWAVKLMLAYFNQIWRGNCFRTRGIFISVPEFFDRERLRMNNQDEEFIRIRDSLLDADLVIWDDVSIVKMTEYNSATFFNFVDARVLSGKANIFTGNLDQEKLKEFVGGRWASRIWNTSQVIEFVDCDKRGRRDG